MKLLLFSGLMMILRFAVKNKILRLELLLGLALRNRVEQRAQADMDGSMDRLAMVSGVMFDQRLLDLRKENEDLRHQLAMLRFAPSTLNHLLAEVNDTGLTEVCNCLPCFFAKRFSQVDPEDLGEMGARHVNNPRTECILKKCLKFHMHRLGLTFQDFDDSSSSSEEDSDDHPRPEECDCHIVIEDNGTFWTVDYGAKLCTTNFHRHPDLPVLEALFNLISDGEDFFKIDGVDYRQMAEDAV